MEAVLAHSQRVCPFLKKTSPATLRTLSTSVAHNAAVAGGKMSNLQVLGRRCPVMGKALAVQSSRMANMSMNAAGGIRSYHSKINRNMHTSAEKKARAVDVEMLRHDPGVSSSKQEHEYTTNTTISSFPASHSPI